MRYIDLKYLVLHKFLMSGFNIVGGIDLTKSFN